MGKGYGEIEWWIRKKEEGVGGIGKEKGGTKVCKRVNVGRWIEEG